MNEVPSNIPPEFAGLGTARSLQALGRPGVAWAVLGLCLLVTWIARQVALEQVEGRGQERFFQHIEQVTNAIQTRIQGCEQVLKGAEGLFAASEYVARREWRQYVASLDINERYPGIRALGFIEDLRPDQLAAFVISNHLDGASEFDIHPPVAGGSNSPCFIVKYVDPSSSGSPSLGFNLASEPRQREAAELARDTGAAVLTAKLKTLRAPQNQPSVLLLAPIYRHGTNPTNQKERRAAIEGWVYAAIVMEELMAGLLESRDPEIDFEIFDSIAFSLPNILYDADRVVHAINPKSSTFSTEKPVFLSVAHRTWSLGFSTRPAFDAATDYTEPRLLSFGGVCISFLLFGITRSLASTRQRALVLAYQMTEKFRIQERAVISSNNGIFITDTAAPNNPIIYANPALEKITGYTAEEIIGRNPRFVLREDTAQTDLRNLQDAMAAGEECQVVLRSYRKDGSLFWNELSVSPVRDEHGIVNHFVGITEDITERKRAEETLRATSALQRAILDSAGYAVISTSAEGVIRIFNAAAERMTGYKSGEVIGRPTSILIHDWTEVERRAAELSAELGRPVPPGFEVFVAKARLGQADEHEWTYLRKDGSRLPVLLSVTPVRDERGVILGFMGIASDITERKRAQVQLQQATQAAESASRAKGEFLANMSHEIRTPMNAVMGMTELALGTDLTREQRGYLTAARNSAADLLTIINDVLDFSKIEAGKLELHPEPFHLRDELGVVLKNFGLRAAEKGLELTLRVHPDVPDMLAGDVGRLRQILNNLVSNAVKFTEKGEVAVEVLLEKNDVRSANGEMRSPTPFAPHISYLPPLTFLHFLVSDTGIGVPIDKQKAIFEAFTQADASVTRQYGGTGLGLAIAGQLCRLMGGEIWVESVPGQGSRFHFTARLEEANPQVSAATPSTAQGLEGVRILVVDDNATSRRVLCEMLANWRMKPTAAGSVEEALAALRDAAADGPTYRFALLDATMPGADGFSLARAIHRKPEEGPSIIMMLSAASRSEEIARCRAAGVERYLFKPLGQSELLDALLRHADTAAGPPAIPQALMAKVAQGVSPRRVLLAEDNAINRELATTVLQKLGHSVVAVWNGQEVLDSWSKGGFDLILMDVQMPIMDGLETTAQIRRQEEGTGRRIPIIGLTAHAMKGDREHGLAAGMDEYLTKPLQLDELGRAIEGLASKGDGARMDASSAFDPARLLKSFGGDEAALRRLVTLFVESTPPLVESMRRAAQDKDAPALHQAVHTLKGSLTLFEDAELRALAAALERQARAGGMDESVEMASRLGNILDTFTKSLQRWLDGNS